MTPAEFEKIQKLLKGQAKVHEKQNCRGLPLCASCRAVAILESNMDLEEADKRINGLNAGTKLFLS